ncbi:hypothetical protein ABZ942_19785 [Nocardia sp. NPDC046473]|uniref:hypothetical protein n=1 Tax=Nocardia sp. NPDC046473 TaxID=3155733 RepID=UPI003402B112
MNHNKRAASRYGDLEFDYRDQIISGLRGSGAGYREIARLLGISARKVEAGLGEIAALHENGYSQSEISRRVGLPRTTVQDLLRSQRSSMSTARKTTALAALSEMHGMQVDVLAWFLGMEKNHTYSLVKALFEDKRIGELEQVQPGEKWVVPTRVTAARYLGWRPRDWHPPLMYAEHYRAVGQARIMLVGTAPERWISERRLWQRAKDEANESRSGLTDFSTGRAPRAGRPHIHDGRFLGEVEGQRGWWALEVELSVKHGAHMDTALQGALRAARDATPESVVGLLYLCRSASVADNVNAAYDRLPRELAELSLLFAIGDFDDEWTSYLARRNKAKAAKRHGGNGLHITGRAS